MNATQGFFHDQVAIVTGASSGIGRALALQLAGQGACVALAARDAARLEAVAAECRQHGGQKPGGQALVVPTDVGQESQCQALVERTCQEFGRIDLLVNNAGIAVGGALADLPDLKLFKQVIDVNLYGNVYCTYYALPHLLQSKGRILAISSMGGKAAIPFNTPYSASKYGVHGFYDSLRVEVASAGVSVTVVCPYWVVTEFHERQMDKDGNPRGPRGRAMYTKKMMTADQCAARALKAAAARKREVLMGPGFPAVFLKTIAPGLIDWLTMKVFLEPAIKRARANK